MTDKELMQEVLEALQSSVPTQDGFLKHCKVMNHIRIRLAQPEQDPVCAHGIGKTKCSFCHQPQPEQEPVAHTLNCVCGAVWDVSPDGVEEMVHAPNPPQRKPLTDEEILTYRHMIDWTAEWSYINFARAIEAAHGIKGEA